MRVAIPSYLYPGESWRRILEAKRKPALVVINPHNGPGDIVDTEYKKLVVNLNHKHIPVLGYIYTSWGKRDIDVISREKELYDRWYSKISGYFLDEASTKIEDIEYYLSLREKMLGLFVLNPGTWPNPGYARKTSAILMTQETDMDHYEDSEVPFWVKEFNAGRFWHCIYNVPTFQDAKRVVKLAKKKRAGFVWITSDTLDNPYDTIPDYYEDLLKFVPTM